MVANRRPDGVRFEPHPVSLTANGYRLKPRFRSSSNNCVREPSPSRCRSAIQGAWLLNLIVLQYKNRVFRTASFGFPVSGPAFQGGTPASGELSFCDSRLSSFSVSSAECRSLIQEHHWRAAVKVGLLVRYPFYDSRLVVPAFNGHSFTSSNSHVP